MTRIKMTPQTDGTIIVKRVRKKNETVVYSGVKAARNAVALAAAVELCLMTDNQREALPK